MEEGEEPEYFVDIQKSKSQKFNEKFVNLRWQNIVYTSNDISTVKNAPFISKYHKRNEISKNR